MERWAKIKYGNNLGPSERRFIITGDQIFKFINEIAHSQGGSTTVEYYKLNIQIMTE